MNTKSFHAVVCVGILITASCAQQPADICTGKPEGSKCWMELQSHPGRYVWIEYLTSGEVATWSGEFEGNRASGKGILERTSRDGVRRIEGTLKVGKWHGITEIRVDDYIIKMPWVDGKRHGTAVQEYADGTVIEVPWVDDKRHGTMVQNNADGTVIETPWVDGKRHGMAVQQYADGKVIRTSWVDGKRHGTEVFRYADGGMGEIHWVDGKKHGTEVYHSADGDEMGELPWVHNERHGTEVYRYADGSKYEIHWVFGKRHGTEVQQDVHGNIIKIPWIDGEKLHTCYGKPEGSACWLELKNRPGCYVWDPDLMDSETVTWTGECDGIMAIGDGTLTFIGPDGQRHESGTLKGGKWHGSVVTTVGNMITRTPYIDGVKHGTEKWESLGGWGETHYQEGKKHGIEKAITSVGDWEIPWVNGKMHGTVKRVTVHGHSIDIPYVDGKKHGIQIMRNDRGLVRETIVWDNDERLDTSAP